ncbi:MAG: terpene cyclase/mutase family protein [Pirellulales bacterium]|nr:terpene cyclase/mutase family protein [Pirellulales bacterium]
MQQCNKPSRYSARGNRHLFSWAALSAGLLSAITAVGLCEEKATGPDPVKYQATFDKGIKYLAAQQQEDGSISGRLGIGPTALCILALLRSGRSPDDPLVAKGLAYLEEATQETGGIHMPGGRIPNYETCIAMLCFKEANKDGKYDTILKAADKFLRGGQIAEDKGKDKSDPSYGGMGYGGRSRPDLSNTAFMIDALRSCGADADDPAIQKALAFVSRCQNLESEYNTTKFADKVNDGGFFYTGASGKSDSSRGTPEGGLRSYGSMSYSGLKSLIYAGLEKDDPRLKAAIGWIRKNYTLTSNPGMGDAGLYYYYHTFAKAMNVLGEEPFEDAKGVKHDWRKELFEALAGRQNENGSWVNENQRWMEGDPNLATSFALLALTYCRPTAEK